MNSRLKTPLAVLRSVIELKAEALAELIGCSPATIKSVESGRLKLSASLAERIAVETGISPHWLLAGDPSASPEGLAFKNYARKDFEEIQALKLHLGDLDEGHAVQAANEFQKVLSRVFESARQNGKFQLAVYRASEFVGRCIQEFGQSKNNPKKPVSRSEEASKSSKAEDVMFWTMFAPILAHVSSHRPGHDTKTALDPTPSKVRESGGDGKVRKASTVKRPRNPKPKKRA